MAHGLAPRSPGTRGARDLAAALAAAGVTQGESVGLWLGDETGAGSGRLLSATRRINLETRLGPLSGALGVLQCATAAAHLESGAAGNVLATAGGPRDDAAAAVLLTR